MFLSPASGGGGGGGGAFVWMWFAHVQTLYTQDNFDTSSFTFLQLFCRP